MDHDHSHHEQSKLSFWRTRSGITLLVMGAIAGYFLLSEHQAHVIGALPYLLLLGCLLMHVFMHGGHGGHSGHGSPDAGKAARIESPPESQQPRVDRAVSTADTPEPK